MGKRIIKPYTGGIFHVFNRSINGEVIFDEAKSCDRMLTNIIYYRQTEQPVSLSYYLAWCAKNRSPMSLKGKKLITLLSYCLMPTHFHFLISQNEEHGISEFMALVTRIWAGNGTLDWWIRTNSSSKPVGKLFEALLGVFWGTIGVCLTVYCVATKQSKKMGF